VGQSLLSSTAMIQLATRHTVSYYFTKLHSVSNQEDLRNPSQVHTADWYCGGSNLAGYTISPPNRMTTMDPFQMTTMYRIW